MQPWKVMPGTMRSNPPHTQKPMHPSIYGVAFSRTGSVCLIGLYAQQCIPITLILSG